jgi:hypothetical protein
MRAKLQESVPLRLALTGKRINLVGLTDNLALHDNSGSLASLHLLAGMGLWRKSIVHGFIPRESLSGLRLDLVVKFASGVNCQTLQRSVGREQWQLSDTETSLRDVKGGIGFEKGSTSLERRYALLDFDLWKGRSGGRVREDD